MCFTLRRVSFSRLAACLAVLWLAGSAGPALAQRASGQPGKFDFYVLSLSWSPSYCADSAGRGRGGQDPQCGPRPFSFVVHGLWPQFERGFPENCQVPSPRLNRNTMMSMLDLMPSPRLIFHEWDTHGTCSGLSADAYFDTIRKAREAVKIPPQYTDLPKEKLVTPDEVENAFVEANPGLGRGGIAVDCGGRRLNEVRICMTRDLQFRECQQVVRNSCRRDQLVMPPVRGG